MEIFHERLRSLREERGEKQETIARYLKVSTQSYSTYENGREPKYEHLCMLAEYFHVTTDYILGLSIRKHDAHADNYPQELQDVLARVEGALWCHYNPQAPAKHVIRQAIAEAMRIAVHHICRRISFASKHLEIFVLEDSTKTEDFVNREILMGRYLATGEVGPYKREV